MAEHSRTLHYDRESQTSGVRLYTTQGEVTNPTVITTGNVVNEGTLSTTAADDITPALRLRDGNTTVYAPLLEVAGNNEGLMASVNGKNYTATPKLDSMTPAQIKAIVNAGMHTKFFNVGDSFPITLNGTWREGTIHNQTIKAKIIGFDHNKATETNGKSSITFGIADTTGVDALFSTATAMNSPSSNSGGWNGSYMRNTLCTEFYNLLPSDLKAVIGSVTKYSDNTGGGSNTASYVTATTDKIFLLSEYEVFGTRTYANSAEQNYQQQYDYYKDGGSKIRYNSGSAYAWWLRSVFSTNNTAFCYVRAEGDSVYATQSYIPYGFAPCFTIVAD